MPRGFTRRQILATGAASVPFLAAPAIAQGWRPAKPVRIVVGDATGGGTDTICRVFLEYMSRKLGETLVPENKAGANGVVAATELKNAKPDGYTLMYIVSSALMTQKVLYKSLPYDHAKDFQPVGACPVAGLVLLVHQSTGATNLEQFIDFARKNPASIGTYGAGSLAHIGVAAIEKQFGVSFSTVHYRGGAPMFADIAGGSLHAAIGGGGGSLNVVDLGKVRAVAIQGRNRLMKFPNVPTFLEMGFKERGLSMMGHTCMMAPAGVPENIVSVYSDLMVESGRDEATWQRFMIAGAEERPIGREALKRWIVEEGPLWAEQTSALGLSPS